LKGTNGLKYEVIDMGGDNSRQRLFFENFSALGISQVVIMRFDLLFKAIERVASTPYHTQELQILRGRRS
jgi:hypothetical protein